MSELDTKIYNAIKRLDWYFGPLNYVICGSVGLYIQGINLERAFHDFDILVPGVERKYLLRLWRLVFKQSGFKLDFPEIPKTFQDMMPERQFIEMKFQDLPIKVQEVNDILRYKQVVADNNIWSDFSNQKQKEDIQKIKQTYNI